MAKYRFDYIGTRTVEAKSFEEARIKAMSPPSNFDMQLLEHNDKKNKKHSNWYNESI